MNWKDALQRLKDGNGRFTNAQRDTAVPEATEIKRHVNGQSPYAIILSCADSRVAPELAFDTGIGEVFVLRVAGNVANTSTIASIEYAVANLNTKLIVVMGHQSCGAVGAAVAGGDNGPNLNKLVSYIQPAVDKLGKEADLADIVKENANISASTLTSQSDIISNAVASDGVKIVSAYYNLDSGKVDFL